MVRISLPALELAPPVVWCGGTVAGVGGSVPPTVLLTVVAPAVHSLIELGPIELVDELGGGAEGGGGAMPRCSSAVCISNTRHSIAFFIFITPALTACWFASAVVLASTSARAASTKERAPASSAFVSLSSFRRTPADSYASAAAVVDALALELASNSFVFHRWSSS